MEEEDAPSTVLMTVRTEEQGWSAPHAAMMRDSPEIPCDKLKEMPCPSLNGTSRGVRDFGAHTAREGRNAVTYSQKESQKERGVRMIPEIAASRGSERERRDSTSTDLGRRRRVVRNSSPQGGQRSTRARRIGPMEWESTSLGDVEERGARMAKRTQSSASISGMRSAPSLEDAMFCQALIMPGEDVVTGCGHNGHSSSSYVSP
jgi:hypothetical protein